MKGAHLRRTPWPVHFETSVFLLALFMFGIGIGLAVEALHDKRTESIVPASTTTTTVVMLTDPVVATTTVPTTAPAENPRLLTPHPSKSRGLVPTRQIGTALSIVESTTTTTEALTTALKVAQSQVGKTGPYAEGGFYCAKFVSWAAEQAKVEGWESSDSPARLHTNAMEDGRIVAAPFVGYLVFIDLTGQNFANKYVSHVGIVESVNGDEFVSIEGNSDDSGLVKRVTRKVGDGYVIAFAAFENGGQ